MPDDETHTIVNSAVQVWVSYLFLLQILRKRKIIYFLKENSKVQREMHVSVQQQQALWS